MTKEDEARLAEIRANNGGPEARFLLYLVDKATAERDEQAARVAELLAALKGVETLLRDTVEGVVDEDGNCGMCGGEMQTEREHDFDPGHEPECVAPPACAALNALHAAIRARAGSPKEEV